MRCGRQCADRRTFSGGNTTGFASILVMSPKAGRVFLLPATAWGPWAGCANVSWFKTAPSTPCPARQAAPTGSGRASGATDLAVVLLPLSLPLEAREHRAGALLAGLQAGRPGDGAGALPRGHAGPQEAGQPPPRAALSLTLRRWRTRAHCAGPPSARAVLSSPARCLSPGTRHRLHSDHCLCCLPVHFWYLATLPPP